MIVSDKRQCLTQVDGFYSLLLTAKRVDTEVRPDNGRSKKIDNGKKINNNGKKNDTHTGGKIPNPSLHVTGASRASMAHYRQLNAGRMENIRLPRIPITTVTLLSSKLTNFFSAFLTVASLISHLLSSQSVPNIHKESARNKVAAIFAGR